jgi:hypothetical protein
MARFDVHRLPSGVPDRFRRRADDPVGNAVDAARYRASSDPQASPGARSSRASHVLAVHLVAAVSRRELGPAIGNLDSEYDRIVAAIDMILLGY